MLYLRRADGDGGMATTVTTIYTRYLQERRHYLTPQLEAQPDQTLSSTFSPVFESPILKTIFPHFRASKSLYACGASSRGLVDPHKKASFFCS